MERRHEPDVEMEAKVSRLRDKVGKLEHENAQLKDILYQLKRENRQLALEIDRLVQNMSYLQEREET